MKTVAIVGLFLTLAFGMSLSGYLLYCRYRLRNATLRLLVWAAMGVGISTMLAAGLTMAVWPPLSLLFTVVPLAVLGLVILGMVYWEKKEVRTHDRLEHTDVA